MRICPSKICQGPVSEFRNLADAPFRMTIPVRGSFAYVLGAASLTHPIRFRNECRVSLLPGHGAHCYLSGPWKIFPCLRHQTRIFSSNVYIFVRRWILGTHSFSVVYSAEGTGTTIADRGNCKQGVTVNKGYFRTGVIVNMG